MLAAVGALLVSACTPEATEDALLAEEASGSPSNSGPLSCESDLVEVISLLRSGLPDYDYEPAADLETLVDESDMVLTGTISSVVRPPGGTHTVVSISDSRVLHLGSTLDNEDLSSSEISMSSPGVQGADRERMAVPTEIEGLAFVAFLLHDAGPRGGLLIKVQGLVVSCGGADETAMPIVEPLPRETSGMSVEELVESVVVLDE